LLGDAPVYVRLRHAGSGRKIEDAPVLAVSTATPRTILGAGREAAHQAALSRSPPELVYGFDHPRLLLVDFLVAERTLRQLLGSLPPPALVAVPADVLSEPAQ